MAELSPPRQEDNERESVASDWPSIPINQSTSLQSFGLVAPADKKDVPLDALTSLTWTQAVEKARGLQHQEADRKLHPKYLYLGSNCVERILYRQSFAPSIYLKVYQYVCGGALVPLSYFAMSALNYTDFSCVGMLLVTWNWFVKTPSIGDLFQRKDSIVYDLPRMMTDDARKVTFEKAGMFRCRGITSVFLLSGFLINFSMCVALLLIRLYRGEMSHSGTIFNATFWPLMMLSNSIWPVSFQFIGLSKGLCRMIDEFRIYAYKEPSNNAGKQDSTASKRRIDWKNAFENYQVLEETVARFSSAFASYFFVAEFFLLVAYVCIVLAVVSEINIIVDWETTPQQFLRAGSMFVIAVMYTWICFDLFTSAASITAKCQALKVKAHRLCAQIEWEDPSSLPVAHRFYGHIERGENTVGFKSMGILISQSLVAKLAYTFSSLASAAVLYSLRSTN